MAPPASFRAVVVERCDPSTELRRLAAKLQGELKDQETKLTVDHFESAIVIAYDGIVALYWRL